MAFGDPVSGHVGNVDGGTGTTFTTAALSFGTSAGNTLVFAVRSGGTAGTITGFVAEDGGTVFKSAILADAQHSVTSTGIITLWFFPCAGGTNGNVKIRINQTGSTTVRLCWSEYVGVFNLIGSTFTDGGATKTNNFNSGNLTTSQTTTLLSAAVFGRNTGTGSTIPSFPVTGGTTNSLTWTVRQEMDTTGSPNEFVNVCLMDFNGGGQAPGIYAGVGTLNSTAVDNWGAEIYAFVPPPSPISIIPPPIILGQRGLFIYEEQKHPFIASAGGGSRTSSDILSGVDSATQNVVLARTASDTLSGTDSANQNVVLARTASDNLSGIDSGIDITAPYTKGPSPIPPEYAYENGIDLYLEQSKPFVTANQHLSRTSSDILSGVDSATQNVALSRTASDILSGTDSATQNVVLARTASDTLSGIDSGVGLATTLPHIQIPIEFLLSNLGLIYVHPPILIRVNAQLTANDVLSGIDSATQNVVLSRTSSDILSGVDTGVQFESTIPRAPVPVPPHLYITEGVDVYLEQKPPITQQHAFFQFPVDSLLGTDTITRAQSEARTGNDGLAGTDAATQNTTQTRTGSDALGGTDVATQNVVLSRTTNDILSGVDSGFGNVTKPPPPKPVAPVLILGNRGLAVYLEQKPEMFLQVNVFPNANGDALNGYDTSATRALSLNHTASDILSGTDSATQNTIQSRTVSDILSGVDTSAFEFVVDSRPPKPIPPDKILAQYGNNIWLQQRHANTTSAIVTLDNLFGSDIATQNGVLSRTASDILSGVDSATQNIRDSRTASDILSGVDSATRQLSESRTASDILSGTDSGKQNIADSRTSSDILSGVDAATQNASEPRTASDILSGVDGAIKAVSLFRTASDVLSGIDSVAIASYLKYIPAIIRVIPPEFISRDGIRIFQQQPRTNPSAHLNLSTTASESLSGIDSLSAPFTIFHPIQVPLAAIVVGLGIVKITSTVNVTTVVQAPSNPFVIIV